MEYEKTPLFGVGLTVLVDLVIPAVMLAASAYSLSNATTKAEIDRLLRKKWKFAAAQLVYYLGDALYGLVTDKKIDWGDLISAATVLFKPTSFDTIGRASCRERVCEYG